MNTKYLQSDTGKIAYDDNGSGSLVICVPGMGDLRAEYRFLAPQLLSAGYRVVTMDVRGHGETSTTWPDYSVAGTGEDILAMARNLDAGPAVIIGTSMAAGAAIWAAAQAPELAAGLILIGPAVRGETNFQSRLVYKALFTRPWGPAVWLWYFSTLYPSHKPDDFDAYKSMLRANLKEPGRMEALQRMITASKAASERRVTEVKAPALVIMGSKDPDFKDPEAEAKWVADNLRGKYKIMRDAGHYPHAEMPVETGVWVLSFLQELIEIREQSHAA
jgi:pimeloyl-ACP methyl ester carboxylesterase